MCLFTSYRLHRMPKPSTAYKWQDIMQKTFRERAMYYNMQRRLLIQIWGNNNIRLWSWHWLEMEWRGGHWRSNLHKYVHLCQLILSLYVEVICFGTENPSGGKTTCCNIFAGFEVFAKHANELCESLPLGRGSRVTSRGSRVNGRGSKNPPQLFLNVVKSKFRVYSSFRCLFYFYINT